MSNKQAPPPPPPPPPGPPPPPPPPATKKAPKATTRADGRKALRKTVKEKWEATLRAGCQPATRGFDTREECEEEHQSMVAQDGLRIMLTNIDKPYKKALAALETIPDKQKAETKVPMQQLEKLEQLVDPTEGAQDQMKRLRARLQRTQQKYQQLADVNAATVSAVEQAWKERIFDQLDNKSVMKFYEAAKGSFGYDDVADAFKEVTGKALDTSAPLGADDSAGEGGAMCFCIDCAWNAYVKAHPDASKRDTPFRLQDGTKVYRTEDNKMVMQTASGDDVDVDVEIARHRQRTDAIGLCPRPWEKEREEHVIVPAKEQVKTWTTVYQDALDVLDRDIGEFLYTALVPSGEFE